MPAENFIIDASVALEILLQSPAGASLADRLLGADVSLHAPHLLDVEVAQVLRRYVISKQVTPQRGGEAVRDLADFPLRRYPHDFLLPRIWQLRGNVTAYDATYLALAEAMNAPVLTRDRRLAKAPGNRARIELV
ncbi:MAG: type II toxin-antitoxin system VapC family toxin [Akkermansiaceae bacterium]|nr:type II toxin-antitoxin system VapC family toxin [Akkermansiaceae bacterium]NNM30602.1 type II toxin-antitoxin system VapC family toxin [Akkermansiaceae bacterium]